MAKDEMGMASGYVSWLSDGANEFPVFVPSGDTDMVTMGIGALTSTRGNEVIVSQLNVDELRGDARSRGLFEARMNKLLGRDDLKVVPLLRAEEGSPGTGLSFQEFRARWKPPVLFYGSIYADDKEATVVRDMSIEEYQAQGGAISWLRTR
ncbi:hypothetical protein [Dyella humicola]|uniref:hypothetical protein n=1 Tax=Dyella humicola TaxID=2992126 RepID=UPI0022544A5D|nr:hypothetical protein [Dyella humicola]